MNTSAILCRLNLGAIVASVICLSGCSGEMQEEDVGQLQQAFGSSSCGSATADQTFSNFVDPKHVSPSSYNTCFRGYVVDINNLSSSYTGTGSGGGYDAHIAVTWEGTVPTTQAACEAAWGAAIFYKKVSGVWVDQTSQIDAYGTWFGGIVGCQPPEVTTLGSLTMTAGTSYRVAATMRTAYGGSTLRAVGIQNFDDLDIP